MTFPDTRPVRGIYLHYRGAHYEVYEVAQHSETEEPLVIYRALYGEYGLWCRPLDMFMEAVITEDGREVPRFRLIKAIQ